MEYLFSFWLIAEVWKKHVVSLLSDYRIYYISKWNGSSRSEFTVLVYRFTDWFLQKLLRYEHHVENYKLPLDQEIIPFALWINKAPAIQPISEDFNKQWNIILYDSEKRLVRFLLEETFKVVEKTRAEFNENLEMIHIVTKKRKIWFLSRMRKSRDIWKQNEGESGLNLKTRGLLLVLTSTKSPVIE